MITVDTKKIVSTSCIKEAEDGEQSTWAGGIISPEILCWIVPTGEDFLRRETWTEVRWLELMLVAIVMELSNPEDWCVIIRIPQSSIS